MTAEWGGPERSELRSRLVDALTYANEDLQRDDLGPLNFRAGTRDIGVVRKLLSDLTSADLDRIGPSRLSQLTAHLTTIRDYLKQIKEFDPVAISNPGGARDTLLANLRSAYEVVYDLAAPVLAVASRREEASSALLDEARAAVAEIQKFRTDAQAEREASSKEIQEILTKARSAAAAAGVSQYAKLFADEAVTQRAASTGWLWTTAILAAGTLTYTLIAAVSPFGFLALPERAETATSIQLGLAKALIFTVLISAVVWTGRNFRAARHNYIVNQHRSNALGTFETFANAAGSDAATKNAVLLQATLAIFSPQPSGYVSQDSDTGTTTQALDVLRGITGQPRA